MVITRNKPGITKNKHFEAVLVPSLKVLRFLDQGNMRENISLTSRRLIDSWIKSL